ncbi:MAG TPA: MFS transporter, partial [Burkholderiaceae bacterium]|nr:MFS transporter [Burkholderiaceae bacterium]
MEQQNKSPASSRRHVWQMVLACLMVLLLAQALVGALGWSALNRLVAGNTADRIELSVRKAADTIQGGLNMGKPLAQYFGVEQVLESVQDDIPGLTSAQIVLPDSQVLAETGTAMDAGLLMDVINGRSRAEGPVLEAMPSGSVRRIESHQVQLGVPLAEPDAQSRGALVVSVDLADAASGSRLLHSSMVMLVITLAAAVALVLLLRYGLSAVPPAYRARWQRLIPVAVLLLAQTAVAVHTTQTFRNQWLDVANENARTLAAGVQSDLHKVLSYGIAFDRIVGVDDYLHRVVASFPVIERMRVVRPDGDLIAHSDRTPGEDDFSLALSRGDEVVARLGVRLDGQALQAGVWSRIIDAATVGLIAVIAAMELLGLLELAGREGWLQGMRRWHDRRLAGRALPPELARYAMFGLLFAWSLPLGFMPLYARSLVVSPTSSSVMQFLMALPIVVEMAAGLMAALLAGRLTDRHGWPRPVLWGFFLSVAGSLACAWADTLHGLATARALVGVGYGLAWMGLQGLVVLNSPAKGRGHQMSNLIAGLFAGYLSGAAVGAMLMQQVGAKAVFVLGAVLFLLPALAVSV